MSDRVNTRKTTEAHAARDRRRREPPETTPQAALNGYDAELAQRATRGGGQRQAP